MSFAHYRSRRGMTLIEVTMVVFVLALLLALVVPTLKRFYDDTSAQASKAKLHVIGNACEAYYQDFRAYPLAAEDSSKPGWEGRHLLVQALTGYLGDAEDNAEGFGFRIKKPGPVFGPYGGTEQLPMGVVQDGDQKDAHISFIDVFGASEDPRPILYYSFRNGQYHKDDNTIEIGGKRINEYDIDEVVKTGPNAYFRTNFILITPGPDGMWDMKKAEDESRSYDWRSPDNDDITNFIPEQ